MEVTKTLAELSKATGKWKPDKNPHRVRIEDGGMDFKTTVGDCVVTFLGRSKFTVSHLTVGSDLTTAVLKPGVTPGVQPYVITGLLNEQGDVSGEETVVDVYIITVEN